MSRPKGFYPMGTADDGERLGVLVCGCGCALGCKGGVIIGRVEACAIHSNGEDATEVPPLA